MHMVKSQSEDWDLLLHFLDGLALLGHQIKWLIL